MNEVEMLQIAIKKRLGELGLSQSDLAKKVYFEDHDEDNEHEVAKFTDALKKHLARPTTPVEKLRRYLEVLRAGKYGLEGYHPTLTADLLPPAVKAQMYALSEKIENRLNKIKNS